MCDLMFDVINAVLRSLQIGSLYALTSLGVSMIYTISRVPNFAQGDFNSIGGYLTFLFASVVVGDFFISLFFSSVLCGCIALLCYFLTFRIF